MFDGEEPALALRRMRPTRHSHAGAVARLVVFGVLPGLCRTKRARPKRPGRGDTTESTGRRQSKASYDMSNCEREIRHGSNDQARSEFIDRILERRGGRPAQWPAPRPPRTRVIETDQPGALGTKPSSPSWRWRRA